MEKILNRERKIKGRKSTKLRDLSAEEKEKIYHQYIKLVSFIAKKYIKRSPNFTFEDLIQEGILGLFQAAEKFNEQKGYRFSTYAFWWIRQAITRALANQSRTIRIPTNMIRSLTKYKNSERKLLEKLNRKPQIEEIAAEMKITINRAQQIKKCMANSLNIFSLEKPVGGDEYNSSLSEFIEDKKETLPEELASRNILKEDLERTIEKTLTAREEKIIKMRFGLEDGVDHTLEKIGQEMGLSRERIRQIIKKALRELRKSKKIKSSEI